MGKHLIGRGVRTLIPACLVIFSIVALSDRARAAGEWEWTAGQGWIQGAGASRPTPKEQLNYAYELEQRGEFMDAARQYFLLIQNFDSSQEAGIGLQRLARCLFEMENFYTSYKAIEQVITTYPNTGRMSDLVEIELRIAKKMLVSQTPDILSEEENSSRDFNVRRAIEIVDSVIDHDPYGPVAAEAYLVKGEAHLYLNEINTARTAFETVRDEFPRSDFVERARLGILRCDSLVGQATPQEVQDQLELLRQQENEVLEQRRRSGEMDEFDDVDESTRQFAEIEAAKMMTQADQYRQMGTRKAVQSSEFMYNEIVRRYPGTPQAEEAIAKLGNIKIPREQNRVVRLLREVNLNPFNWNKDPEPPWIVPQMDPEDQVLVDTGIGPIFGVPETGLPQTRGAAGVRPAGLREVELASADSAEGNFTPIGAAPPFIDAASGLDAGNFRGQSAGPQAPLRVSSPPGLPELEPRRPSFANNPLPTITESDLVGMDGAATPLPPPPRQSYYQGAATYPADAPQYGYTDVRQAAPVPQQPYQAAAPVPPAPIPEVAPYTPPASSPNLGVVNYQTPINDLVGPSARRYDSVQTPPMPEYGTGGQYDPFSVYGGTTVQQPPQTYQQPPQVYQPPTYVDRSYNNPGAVRPVQTAPPQSGGWTMGEEFR